MKRKQSYIDSWTTGFGFMESRFWHITFFLFAFFLPINTRISNFFLIISLVLSLYFLISNRLLSQIDSRLKMLFYTTLLFFALHVLGIFYSDYPEDGYRYLEKTISYFLVPIIFLGFTRGHLLKIRRALLRGLIFGSVASLMILMGINLFNYFEGQDVFHVGRDLFNYYHTYHKFTLPLEQHPTYLGLYYLTALIFIDDIVGKKHTQYVLIVFFGVGFLFLNSRVVFLAIVILFGYRGFQWTRRLILNKEFSKLLFLLLGSGLLLVFFVKFISESYIGLRLKNVYRFEISTKNEESFNSRSKSNPRMARYISALKLIQEKPFFGHGTADEYPNLKKQFTIDGLHYAAEQNYNSHNQYLGFAIRFGLFGTLALIFFIIANANLAFREKDFNYLLFILIIACVNLVENYFDRNFGITFSAVFFTTFSYNCLLKKISKHVNTQ